MPEFLDLLSTYYTCDAMVALRPLDRAEFEGCMDIYEAVKRYFAPGFELAPSGTAERIAQMRAAYLGFLDWQAQNAALVADMREAARLTLAAPAPATLH